MDWPALTHRSSQSHSPASASTDASSSPTAVTPSTAIEDRVDAVRAARLIARGHYRVRFWGGVMAAGTVAPALLGWLGAWVHDAAALPAAVLALAGLWVWEDLWVKAGQSIPLS